MSGPDQTPMPRMLTVGEAAERLRTTPYNVREWIRRKRLRATKPFGTWLIPEDAIDELLAFKTNVAVPDKAEDGVA